MKCGKNLPSRSVSLSSSTERIHTLTLLMFTLNFTFRNRYVHNGLHATGRQLYSILAWQGTIFFLGNSSNYRLNLDSLVQFSSFELHLRVSTKIYRFTEFARFSPSFRDARTSARRRVQWFVAFLLFWARRYDITWIEMIKTVINLSFALPGLCLNVHETEKMVQFRDERLWTCVACHSSASG